MPSVTYSFSMGLLKSGLPFESIDVGLSLLKSESQVQLHGILSRRSRCKIDITDAGFFGALERRSYKQLTDTFASGVHVDNDVLDPGMEAGRDTIDYERKDAEDLVFVSNIYGG